MDVGRSTAAAPAARRTTVATVTTAGRVRTTGIVAAVAMLLAAAAPAPVAAASFFVCGAPYAACGKAIPAGVTCTKGPGWCAPGFFCGWNQTTAEASRCLPLPKDCGKVGKACCPSNYKTPHTQFDDQFSRLPMCTDPDTACFYFAWQRGPGMSAPDYYAANKGAYACTRVTPTCGQKAGSACCPSLYHIHSNPPQLPGRGSMCADSGSGSGTKGLWCDIPFDPSRKTTDWALMPKMEVEGACVANEPDCGQFGKSCCVYTGGAATSLMCGAQWSDPADKPRGYCAPPPLGVSYKKYVCNQCPSPAVVAKAKPEEFMGCPRA